MIIFLLLHVGPVQTPDKLLLTHQQFHQVPDKGAKTRSSPKRKLHLGGKMCMKKKVHIISFKKKEIVFCVCNTSLNPLSVRASIIGCQHFYSLSILSLHKVFWCCTMQVFTNVRSVTYHLNALGETDDLNCAHFSNS